MMRDACIEPDILEDGALSAYMAGDAPAVIVNHIDRCGFCAAEVRALNVSGAWLGGGLFRTRCPPIDALLELATGFRPAGDGWMLKGHLHQCNDCREELESIRIRDAPSPVRTLQAAIRSAGALLRRAVPVFIEPGLVAVRGFSGQELRFEADGYEVVLAVSPTFASSPTRQIEGQVSRTGESVCLIGDALVRLFIEDTPVVDELLDEFGYFAVRGVSPGEYSLFLDLPAARVLIEGLRIA